jgi:hypothetical protein
VLVRTHLPHLWRMGHRQMEHRPAGRLPRMWLIALSLVSAGIAAYHTEGKKTRDHELKRHMMDNVEQFRVQSCG